MNKPLPSFTIDLDLPPDQRFTEPTKAFRKDLIDVAHKYLSIIPSHIIQLFESSVTQNMWYYNQYEKYMEIKGIYMAIDDPSISFGKMLLMNSLYELESWCTSVIARMDDGTIIHSRNLDFAFSETMEKITYNAHYVHGKEHSFDAVMFGGIVGTYTGIKKGAFSISEDQRHIGDKVGLAENLKMLFTGYNEISWEIRNVLDTCSNWECAHKRLSSDTINAIGYIIIAGVNEIEGSIITRNRYEPAH